MSRAIPLLHLWALVACYGVNFTWADKPWGGFLGYTLNTWEVGGPRAAVGMFETRSILTLRGIELRIVEAIT